MLPHHFLYRLTASKSACVGIACVLTLVAVILLRQHLRILTVLQGNAISAAAQIPALESRLRILEAQVDIGDVQRALQGDPALEKIRASVIPPKDDLDRLLLTIEILRDWLTEQGMLLQFDPVAVGEAETSADYSGARWFPVQLSGEFTRDGAATFLELLEMTGFVRTGDALQPAQRREILRLSEEEDPAGIAALEFFFNTDLLRYAREPKPFEEQLRKAFASDAVNTAIESLFTESRLARARQLFGGKLGEALSAHRLWPVRLLTPERVALTVLQNDHVRLDLVLSAYVRTE